MRRLPKAFFGWSLGAILATSASARAQGTSAPVADALFRDAARAFQAGRTHEACEKFAESNKLDPQLGTLLYLATCHEKEGRTATALAEFTELLEKARARAEGNRARYAEDHIAALKVRISRVELVIGADVKVGEITMDGASLGAAAWSTPLPLDPGEHTLTFAAPRKKTRELKITVNATPGTQRITIEPLEDEDGMRPLEPSQGSERPVTNGAQEPTSAAQPPPPRAVVAGSRGSKRPLGYVAFGVGVVGLGVGAVFGLRALSKKSIGDAGCEGNRCTADGLTAQSDARTAATISTVGFGVGVAAVALGTYLTLANAPAKSPSTSLRVAPFVGAGSGGAVVQGAW
jgi:hypothetical protein